ncbi:MAG: SDR family NAD(P)-dependent oxidoreductase [Gammaproteobacteria bacterium]|nr:SDR family NAD(P)-dependent oxidoreductase [Gammaproteobacteria bacterium]
MLLKNKVALITGAGSERGIGFATARLFDEHGASTVLLDVNGDGVESSARALGSNHRGYALDVRDPEACRSAVARAVGDFGDIDILVNNAGVVYGTRVTDIAPPEYDEVLDVNLRGNFNMAQAVLPAMRKRGGGNIVCVSSIAGRAGGGVFGSSHYAAAKSGIFGLAKGLARELAPEGIRVNAVAPGPIDNDFTKGKMTDEDKARIARTIPMGRLGTPDEVATVILFLASDLSSYVTGVVLDVNGGLLIC